LGRVTEDGTPCMRVLIKMINYKSRYKKSTTRLVA